MAQARSKTMTAEELLKRSSELGHCELVKGELIEMVPPGEDHADVALTIGLFIGNYVREHNLGKTLTEVGCILDRNPDTVRAPDVAFIQKQNVKPGPRPGYVEGAPDLVVEVVSPNDSASEITTKVDQWLHHGVQLVWVADPKSKIVTAWHPDHRAEVYHVDDTLPGDPVLPGFTLPLRELFKD